MMEINIHISMVLDTRGPSDFFVVSIFSTSVATMQKIPGLLPI